MPIYEYECEICAHRFEEIQSICDDPIEVCERCSEPVRRVPSPVAVRFSGSGWWKTDYKKRQSSGDSKTSSTSSEEPKETKSESSPPE